MAYNLEGLPSHIFPHPLLSEPSGILGVSRELDYDRVLAAYHYGIFPWYSEPFPVQWFYTQPRFVLFLNEFKISKSLRNILNQELFEIGMDIDFDEIITACANVRRKDQDDTWIGKDMRRVFNLLHVNGYAHSVEARQEGKVIGGLYGVTLGKLFFGESMFSLQSNASTVCLVSLVQHLKSKGYSLIDCQQETPHLKSFGARLISGESFWKIIRANLLTILSKRESAFL